MLFSIGNLLAAQRAEDSPAYDIWQRPDTPETCTSLDSLSLNEHLASDFSETGESDTDRTMTPSYDSLSSRSTTPGASYLSDRMTSSSYLPHLNHTYTPGLFPFVKRQHQRDSFYDSSTPISRSLSSQTLQTHRSGPYGDSYKNSPVVDAVSTISPLQDRTSSHRSDAVTSPTLKWSLTPDTLMPAVEPKKLSPTKVGTCDTSKMPPIPGSTCSPSPSRATSNSHSQLQLQSLINCQSQARKTISNSYSYPDQSRHDFYY